jgi:hypothetical protein
MKTQMGSVNRAMKILKRKVLEIKNTVTEIKNIFDGLI